jgi:hypothetical protein
MTREQFADLAREKGWRVDESEINCVRAVFFIKPNAPLGGPRAVIDVFFKANGNIDHAWYGIGVARDLVIPVGKKNLTRLLHEKGSNWR